MKKGLAAAAIAVILIAGLWLLPKKQAGDSSSPQFAPETTTATAVTPAPVATNAAATSTSQSLSTATSPPVSSSTAPPAPARAPDFSETLEKTMASLPTTESIKALPDAEKHHTPAVLIRAAAQLGDVQEMVERDPSRVRDGMAFFTRCARRDDLDDSVRAACLSSLRDIARKVGIAVDEHGIPPRIVQLVNRMKTPGN